MRCSHSRPLCPSSSSSQLHLDPVQPDIDIDRGHIVFQLKRKWLQSQQKHEMVSQASKTSLNRASLSGPPISQSYRCKSNLASEARWKMLKTPKNIQKRRAPPSHLPLLWPPVEVHPAFFEWRGCRDPGGTHVCTPSLKSQSYWFSCITCMVACDYRNKHRRLISIIYNHIEIRWHQETSSAQGEGSGQPSLSLLVPTPLEVIWFTPQTWECDLFKGGSADRHQHIWISFTEGWEAKAL